MRTGVQAAPRLGRSNGARLVAVALLALPAPGAHGQVLHDTVGIQLRGMARLVEPGAGTCSVSEAGETAASYEQKRPNHGQPVDVWQLDFFVHNGSQRWLNHLVADYRIASEDPPCTDWSWPEAGRHPGLNAWGNVAGLIQRTDRGEPVAPGETLTDRRHLFVFHKHEPRFETGSVDFNFVDDVGPPPPSPVDRREVCLRGPSAYPCWMELANEPGCYLWVQRHTNPTVTWSGECSNGYAQGRGAARRTYRPGAQPYRPDHTAQGLLIEGKRYGHWVTRFDSGLSTEGPYFDGGEHGYWMRRRTRGGEREGLMLHGKERGDWEEWREDGTIARGPWYNDDEGPLRLTMPHGYWISWSPDGTTYEGPVLRRIAEGNWLRWESDGHVSQYTYITNQLHGLTIYCGPRGTSVKGVQIYQHGELKSNYGSLAAIPDRELARRVVLECAHLLGLERPEVNG